MSTNNKEIKKNIRIMATRHSAFYSPLLIAVKSSFSSDSAIECTYSVADEDQDVQKMLISDDIDIAQSTVSAKWNHKFKDEIVNFAQINRMDGFFLLRRKDISNSVDFKWSDLINKSIIADHALQPLTTLKYALYKSDIEFNKLAFIDSGSTDNMINQFKSGEGDYIHLQGPEAHQLENENYGHIVTSVGKNVGPLSFSSLICKKSFLSSSNYQNFLKLFLESKIFSATASPINVAERVLDFFPDIDLNILVKTITDYQGLHCWESNLNISENHYDKTLEIFQQFGLKGIHPYSESVNNNTLII